MTDGTRKFLFTIRLIVLNVNHSLFSATFMRKQMQKEGSQLRDLRDGRHVTVEIHVDRSSEHKSK